MLYIALNTLTQFIYSSDYSIWYKLGYLMSPMLVIPATWGIFEQAYVNYKNQSAEALSVHSVMYKFVIYIVATYYATALSFPAVRIVIDYLFIVEFGVLAFQKYYYTKKSEVRRYIEALMVLTAIGSVVVAYYTRDHYLFIGHTFGWFILVANIFGKLPQLIHNWQRNSVKGYSWRYLMLGHISTWLNLFCTFALDLALQTKLLMVYGLFANLVLVLQYVYYDSKARQKNVRSN